MYGILGGLQHNTTERFFSEFSKRTDRAFESKSLSFGAAAERADNKSCVFFLMAGSWHSVIGGEARAKTHSALAGRSVLLA